jgi:hypothetical protein
MALEIIEIHPTADPKLLNNEWITVENTGEVLVNLRGCEIAKGNPRSRKNQKVTKLDPGFALNPKEKRRIVSGNPRSTVQGAITEEKDMENYFLFLKVPYITKPKMLVRVLSGQGVLSQAVWDPNEPTGVGQVEKKPAPQNDTKKPASSKNSKQGKKKSSKSKKKNK